MKHKIFGLVAVEHQHGLDQFVGEKFSTDGQRLVARQGGRIKQIFNGTGHKLILAERTPEDIRRRAYPSDVSGDAPLANMDAHTAYIGQIVDAYIIRED